MVATNLRASVARETPAAAARSSTVHGRAGSACTARKAVATAGSPNAAAHPDGRIDGPADIVISHRTRSGGEGSRGSARTLLASLDWFRSGGWHYQDEGLRRGPLDRHTTMLFPGDTEETAVTKFPQPPVLTIPRHTPVRFVSGVLDVSIHAAVGAMTPDLVDMLPEVPSPTADMRYDLVVDAIGADGVTVRAVLSGVDSYRDSALMAVAAATALVENETVQSGVLAAAEAFAPREFLDALAPHGITWRIEEPVRR
ncbi:hypothetical protein [Nocardia carnea]|uniref:Saccharopine dehydrogenase-like C-terminal domain-containing protein n=1 Tax=Nocardia carnea TaxID=37328 RepID=A0ABW7TS76_9NOCA